ncbi:MAG: dephospho-CoA kinase [Prolixibacteraceae bacterium]|jgi:dephospho-CoA kinase|nr:dephospho-CoA kinase [Prolixibacteraceae bacterium]MDI9565047.1 dephospho-CoA kinase [Bacteroidota bacterium]NLT00490.1 dephospho-CoA kinase [Bacteroidales bacterium]OQB81000.1 MAG: Dephospho-CoA kinase [Bacteroidetes bacterium ADurb.Bin123]HNU76904.1 dephospho-CoA kinase [Prolixibacteraceae bacterium]
MLNTSLKKTDRPFVVGLTGGIGSGKSLVCKVFAILGIPVFEADRVGRSLYTGNTKVKEEMISMFGPGVYLPGGEINRSYLASLIFNDKEALLRVNRLIHPLVRDAFALWRQEQNSDYVVYEAAILFESGYYRETGFTVVVTAPEELRIKRVMERDHVSREQVLARIRNQWDEQKKLAHADFVIRNDEEHLLLEQILETDKKIRSHGKFC